MMQIASGLNQYEDTPIEVTLIYLYLSLRLNPKVASNKVVTSLLLTAINRDSMVFLMMTYDE